MCLKSLIFWVAEVEKDRSKFKFLVEFVRDHFYDRHDMEMIIGLLPELSGMNMRILEGWKSGEIIPSEMPLVINFFRTKASEFLKLEMIKVEAQLNLCLSMLFKIETDNKNYFGST